ncbi:MAG: helix-turn-helix domain-containing protein [Rhodococcus sp. (in: high G+C Gram-positive bacteria)]|nr:helix-turn-helix domain-containing protein [Rhodococcus sp. (in: high G+C Gram-positive bacteria)]
MSPRPGGSWRSACERARELLENTDLTIERIAHDTGFGTATSLRNQLAAELGVSPSAYRATFRVDL